MKIKKSMMGLAAAAVMMAALTGCGGNHSETTTAGTTAAQTETTDPKETSEEMKADLEEEKDIDENLTGSLLMTGSTSMEKLVTAVQEAFMDKYPKVSVNGEFIGSGAGVEAVLAGTSDIGNSSRALKESEKENGAVENIVAIDGIAVIVDAGNVVEDLSKEQLIDIYVGEVTNWSELGGANQPVVVIGRESGSGTRGAFEEILEIADQCVYSNELDNTGAVMAKVASTPGAIGYVSLDVVDDSVKALKLEGSEATADNIKAGNYFLSRPFVMATKGEISEQNEIVQAWFSFLKSAEGIDLIKSVGLIPNEE